MDLLLAAVAVLSALAAAVSAGIAHRSNKEAARRDRANRVREVSLLANRVVATTLRVDELGNELKIAYQTLFTFAGQGGSSSGRLKMFIKEIEKKQRAIGPMQTAARELLDDGVTKLLDDKVSEWLLEFDGSLAHLERVREKLHVDLASVESQNQVYRQEQVKVIDQNV